MRLRTCTLVIAACLFLTSIGFAAEEETTGQQSDQAAKRSDVKVELGSDGLEIESASGDFKFRIGGRVQLDAAFHDEDTSSLANGAEIRRARLYVKGKVAGGWAFKSQLDFAGNEVSIKDLYLRYSPSRRLDLTVGNFKEPFSLEDQTSSKDITFLERALPVAAFSPSRALGVAINRGGDRSSLAFGVFGEEVAFESADRDDEGVGVAARATWAPMLSKRKMVHLGIAGEYREPRNGQELRFDARPESVVSGEKLVRTGGLDDVSSTTRYGLEIATATGPLSFQGEYIATSVRRPAEPEAKLGGWYGYVSWFLTGETRPYAADDGSFGRIEPRSKRGAWEIGLRFSSLDLDDVDIRGGQEDNLTLGLNWYASSNVRFLVNYTWVESERRGEIDSPSIFHARAQIAF